MLATSVVHDEQMAALEKTLLQDMSPSELPPSMASSAVSSVVSLPRLEEEASLAERELKIQQNECDCCDDAAVDRPDEEDDEEEDPEPFAQLMDRGNYLRQLRLLALADEQERQASQECVVHSSDGFCEEKKEDFDDIRPSAEKVVEDEVIILPNKDKVLNYESYLSHQRYYDDLKHVDIKYMDFGTIPNSHGVPGGRLVVEQQKHLGKGGFCWDAGFILGEHVIAHEHEWNANANNNVGTTSSAAAIPRIVELGAGTGLTGLMIAKATRSEVVVTDLPELAELMRDNVVRNFGSGTDIASSSDEWTEALTTNDGEAKGTISSRVLRWGIEDDYGDAPYDVILGADIVTSLYDPVALAQTLHALAGPGTKIYLSGKARLDKPHEEFDAEMRRLFERVVKVGEPSSRLGSPDVFIIVAEGKR